MRCPVFGSGHGDRLSGTTYRKTAPVGEIGGRGRIAKNHMATSIGETGETLGKKNIEALTALGDLFDLCVDFFDC